jgi:hypothetical protein
MTPSSSSSSSSLPSSMWLLYLSRRSGGR